MWKIKEEEAWSQDVVTLFDPCMLNFDGSYAFWQHHSFEICIDSVMTLLICDVVTIMASVETERSYVILQSILVRCDNRNIKYVSFCHISSASYNSLEVRAPWKEYKSQVDRSFLWLTIKKRLGSLNKLFVNEWYKCWFNLTQG